MIVQTKIPVETRCVQEEPQAGPPIRISLPRLGNSAAAGKPSNIMDELAEAASRITKIQAPGRSSDTMNRAVVHRRPSESFD